MLRNYTLWYISIFLIVWLLPLLMEQGTLIRYALEEFRVLITGLIVGYYLGKAERRKEKE